MPPTSSYGYVWSPVAVYVITFSHETRLHVGDPGKCNLRLSLSCCFCRFIKSHAVDFISQRRAIWYTIEVTAQESSEVSSGIVQILWESDTTLWDYDRMLHDYVADHLKRCWPVKMIACHICCKGAHERKSTMFPKVTLSRCFVDMAFSKTCYRLTWEEPSS